MKAQFIFDRRHHTTLIIWELSAPVKRKDFASLMRESIKELLHFFHPFCGISLHSVEIEDMPDALLDKILKHIGETICFEIHTRHKRRRRYPSVWTKKIKRLALVNVGAWKGAFIPYDYLFVRYSFRRVRSSILLSWSSFVISRRIFLQKKCITQ